MANLPNKGYLYCLPAVLETIHALAGTPPGGLQAAESYQYALAQGYVVCTEMEWRLCLQRAALAGLIEVGLCGGWILTEEGALLGQYPYMEEA
jgi:hypothetical protein